MTASNFLQTQNDIIVKEFSKNKFLKSKENRMTLTIKNVSFVLFLVSGLLMFNMSFAEDANPQGAQPQGETAPPIIKPQEGIPQAPGSGQIANIPPPHFRRSLPPAIFVKGKEGELNRVFVEDAGVNKLVKAEFIAFDIDPAGNLNPLKPIGIPQGATFDITSSEKNKAQAVFSWTPKEKDKGLHGFAFEVSNAKGDINRVALFYDVK